MLRKMKPGEPGTKQLLQEYGEQLLCVRYRYDAKARKRIKTIEIVIAESEWQPPGERFAQDEIVWLRIGFVIAQWINGCAPQEASGTTDGASGVFGMTPP